jgi:hypothetical protein
LARFGYSLIGFKRELVDRVARRSQTKMEVIEVSAQSQGLLLFSNTMDPSIFESHAYDEVMPINI